MKKLRQRNLPPARTGRDRELRIIGGSHRGRRFAYHGDPLTRPMKDRVREAIFNLLGPQVAGKHVIDLFSGTGALALEALSRGAGEATMIEQHVPTARMIRDNLAGLGFDQPARVLEGDAFFHARETPRERDRPWLIFCCPPYAFFVTRTEEMVELIRQLAGSAPPGSLMVVESDQRFDSRRLPQADRWKRRDYPPALIAYAQLPLTGD